MESRNGEKIGWIGGWSGSFVWLLILVVVLMVKGRTDAGLTGLALLGAAVFCIMRFAPWNKPATAYWKLLLPIYGILVLAVAYAATIGAGFGLDLEWRYLLWMGPLVIPFFTMGKRTWEQSGAHFKSVSRASAE